jgi:D-beta-D-heptose 7-phosphate kinase/D-beta-D-heptose 1-phosphate adenosyltransferase
MVTILSEQELLALNLKKLNLITGSFDLLHAGHIQFIKRAKELVPNIPLLVIVLDDKNVSLRKGINRPIYPLADRLILLSAISYIDYLLAWMINWKKLPDFITKLKIDTYFVNEHDPGFKNKQKIAEDNHIKIQTIPRYKDLSTSRIINKIRENV